MDDWRNEWMDKMDELIVFDSGTMMDGRLVDK